ncbi:hypothetical protein C5B42_00440 [Candidatus Cerribacteria bacterium 'Amazon FNV 2010 28 9']|uniref:Uncharacterized protein n=1 Tax=Candidatus Cerribacteria bacterium 'Amazon FNV 2010 28 9' TaxID=2081795 RepID=A0A317JRH5_9BACT|nr:MAG: hypothetical protein C5B42_00440 [Candidatus Cerribacteria bacterium 'Amazon FNV 2010 28 9']
MKLLSFRIKHYRSIDDSNECTLASDVTVLAGKNEAGKTNILQALDKFNQDKKITQSDYPLEIKGDPEITLTFKISDEELEEWVKKLNISSNLNKAKIANIPIVVTKKADNTYIFESPSGSFTGLLDSSQAKIAKAAEEKAEAVASFKDLLTTKSVSISSLTPDVDVTVALIADITTQLEAAFPPVTPEDQEIIKQALEKITDKVTVYEQLSNMSNSHKKEFFESLPKLVLFDSFDQEELLPYQISLSDANKNRAVSNYCSIVGLDINQIIETTDPQFRIKMVNEKSDFIKGDFGDYWKQDEINLTMSSYGDDLIFGIKEKGKNFDFKIEQRSKGLQWFLSFYLLLKAQANNKQAVILVDEPGLYVHAKAQGDILRVLTDLSSKNQIIFSSHSPYLIDPSRLDRIRLVIKNLIKKIDKKDVTEIGSKAYELTSPTADKDTLTPIITAIGLDISKQLTFAVDKNIVLEGISDYNFIQALTETLGKTDKKRIEGLHLIPCKGADNIPMIVSFLIGWGLNYKVLLDNDAKGKEVITTLTDKLQVNATSIVLVSETDNYCIEDIFSKVDFNKHVLAKPDDYEVGRLNSQVIPDDQKAVLSREFLNKVRTQKIKLTSETKNNFKNRLDHLVSF